MTDKMIAREIRALPVNMENEHADYFKRSSFFFVTKAKVVRLTKVFILWNGVIFKNGKVVEESLASPLFKKYSTKFLISCIVKSFLKRNFRRLKRPHYLIVHDEWDLNYFHWLTDALTRLYLSRHLIEKSILLLPESFRLSYHCYTLKKFGVKNIRWANNKNIFFTKEVFLPMHTAPASNYHPELLRRAVRFLVSDMNCILSKGDKIYISREKSSTRKIINEKAVIDILKKEEFTILSAEKFSFEEQVSIFSHAKILISIHGAGLTNLMFMPAGSRVLEFRNRKNTSDANNCYFNLASVFNQQYFYQGGEPDSNLREQEADIFIDIDKLKENLALICESRFNF